jgi:hypothetical protein
VRKVRGPILDKLYAELKRCGDLSCTGRSFIEHRNVPVLTVNRRDSRPAWQQGCGEPDISYVRGGQRVRKDTKTHQDRWLAIDPATCALIANYLDEIRTQLAAVGAELRDEAYLFSNDPAHARPWNPDWVTHQIAATADAAGVEFDIKGGRHYTASQLLAGGFDLRSTAARLGHSGGRATTLRHYADPVPEVDRRGFGSSRW